MNTNTTTVEITSLEDLQLLTKQQAKVTIPLMGKEITLSVRCLTPREAGELQAMIDDVRPPLVPNEDPEKEPRLDFGNKEFIARATTVQRKARALGIWFACPAIRKDGVDLKNQDQILQHVQEVLTERVLETLWTVIKADCTVLPDDEAKLGARVHFTSPAS